MNYRYPEHFKYPEEKSHFFLNHVNNWNKYFKDFGNEPRVCLEIGALYGGSSVYILEEFCTLDGSHLYIMDINTNEFLENNLNPYKDKVTFFKGESADCFRKLEKKEILDFVYIDGNHMSKYVLEDAVNSFYYLKNNGYIIFDDYGGGLEQEPYLQVKTAADAFVHAYHKHIEIVYVGYQVVMRKKEFVSDKGFDANYYKTS